MIYCVVFLETMFYALPARKIKGDGGEANDRALCARWQQVAWLN